MAIFENIRFYKNKRFRNEEYEDLSNIEFDIDKKVLSDAFNYELNMTLKLVNNYE